MLRQVKTVYRGQEAEIYEKKSRFIATVQPIATEAEAETFIEGLRKKYWNASHNCFAYVLGETQGIQRYSDDGEPGGTAGKPILDVLLGEELHNTLIVVTRYFGGTLLGTGGLVRAYQSAAKSGIEASLIITKKRGMELQINTDYTGLGKIQYILGQRGIHIADTEYTEAVNMRIILPIEEITTITAEITEGTSGQAQIKEGAECWFAKIDGNVQIFEGI